MNNTEAYALLKTKANEARILRSKIEQPMEYLSEYEDAMAKWKDSVNIAKIAEIKALATAVGVDLSTWDGSAAPVEEDED